MTQQKSDEPRPLTELRIRALEVRPERYYIRDAGHSGLWIEVFPSGTLAWRYRYRLNGKLEKVALGKYPQITLKAARQKRDELAAMVARGESPALQKQLAKEALAADTTVRQFGERYFSEIVQRDVADTSILRRYLDKEIYPAFGNKCLKNISAADIQSLVFRKRDNGFPSAAAGIRNLLRRIFDYAIVCGVALNNPALATPTRFISRARSRTRALSPKEITSYLHTLYSANIRRQFKLALHIILLTLVRKSEILQADWSEFDFDAAEWQIPEEHTKTKKAHIVYMSRQVSTMFHELKYLAGESKLVMPGRGSLSKPFAENALNKALDGINFEIPPFTIHDMRRTASTLLNEQGFPSDVIEKALNHTIGGVRGVYNRAEYAEQRKQMLQTWANYVDKLLKPEQSREFGTR